MADGSDDPFGLDRIRAITRAYDERLASLRPLTFEPAQLPDPETIPPREWLYGTMLVRKFVTTIVAPGGVGKTAFAIGVACSLAAGISYLGDKIYLRSNVLMCNLEDPPEEFIRRLAAFRLQHNIERKTLDGRIFTINGRDRRLRIASLDGEDAGTVIFPDKEAITALITEHKIGLIVVDPFVNCHELDENNNIQINAAVRAWAEIANDTDCAVLLIHHTRKGAVAGDAEGGRGAKAMVDGSRAAYTLSPMDATTAKLHAVPRWIADSCIQIFDAKLNLAPKASSGKWFKLESVALGNTAVNPLYPAGDNVQAIVQWHLPASLEDVPPTEINIALDQIAAGPGGGARYTKHKVGDRWAGTVLIDQLGVSDEEAKKLLQAWLDNGLIINEKYHDPVQRKERTGITVDPKKPRPTE